MRAPGRRRPLLSVLVLTVLLIVGGAGAGEARQVAEDSFDASPVGAASGVTGGGTDGEVRVVTTLEDDGTGSFRNAAEEPGPAVVLFAVSGEVELDEPIEVASDLTIDGRGADVTLVGKGLLIARQENVIVRNLKVVGNDDSDSNDDAIAIQGRSAGVWIDHVTLTGFEDGLLDVTQGSTDVTVSWSHLHDHDKTMLLGANVREGAPDLVDVTLHHNRFERTLERNPLVRQGRVHVVNNVVEAWGSDSDSGFGVRSDCGAQVLVEANVFRPDENPLAVTIRTADCDPSRPPAVRLEGNDLGTAEIDDDEQRAEDVEILKRDGVVAEPAGEPLLAAVRAGAGWQDVANPLPIEVPEEVEDGPSSDGTPDPGAADDGSDTADDSSTTSYLVAIVIVGALALGVGVWFGRRQR